MFKKLLVPAVTASLVFMTAPLYAETKGDAAIQRPAGSLAAKITSINGNIITIADDRGNTKTLEMSSTKGLAVGAITGWCEQDCRSLKIGDQTIRVQPVIESKR
jgi:hypothetical protein